jgi:hypothetical protein
MCEQDRSPDSRLFSVDQEGTTMLIPTGDSLLTIRNTCSNKLSREAGRTRLIDDQKLKKENEQIHRAAL